MSVCSKCRNPGNKTDGSDCKENCGRWYHFNSGHIKESVFDENKKGIKLKCPFSDCRLQGFSSVERAIIKEALSIRQPCASQTNNRKRWDIVKAKSSSGSLKLPGSSIKDWRSKKGKTMRQLKQNTGTKGKTTKSLKSLRKGIEKSVNVKQLGPSSSRKASPSKRAVNPECYFQYDSPCVYSNSEQGHSVSNEITKDSISVVVVGAEEDIYSKMPTLIEIQLDDNKADVVTYKDKSITCSSRDDQLAQSLSAHNENKNILIFVSDKAKALQEKRKFGTENKEQIKVNEEIKNIPSSIAHPFWAGEFCKESQAKNFNKAIKKLRNLHECSCTCLNPHCRYFTRQAQPFLCKSNMHMNYPMHQFKLWATAQGTTYEHINKKCKLAHTQYKQKLKQTINVQANDIDESNNVSKDVSSVLQNKTLDLEKPSNNGNGTLKSFEPTKPKPGHEKIQSVQGVGYETKLKTLANESCVKSTSSFQTEKKGIMRTPYSLNKELSISDIVEIKEIEEQEHSDAEHVETPNIAIVKEETETVCETSKLDLPIDSYLVPTSQSDEQTDSDRKNGLKVTSLFVSADSNKRTNKICRTQHSDDTNTEKLSVKEELESFSTSDKEESTNSRSIFLSTDSTTSVPAAICSSDKPQAEKFNVKNKLAEQMSNSTQSKLVIDSLYKSSFKAASAEFAQKRMKSHGDSVALCENRNYHLVNAVTEIEDKITYGNENNKSTKSKKAKRNKNNASRSKNVQNNSRADLNINVFKAPMKEKNISPRKKETGVQYEETSPINGSLENQTKNQEALSSSLGPNQTCKSMNDNGHPKRNQIIHNLRVSNEYNQNAVDAIKQVNDLRCVLHNKIMKYNGEPQSTDFYETEPKDMANLLLRLRNLQGKPNTAEHIIGVNRMPITDSYNAHRKNENDLRQNSKSKAKPSQNGKIKNDYANDQDLHLRTKLISATESIEMIKKSLYDAKKDCETVMEYRTMMTKCLCNIDMLSDAVNQLTAKLENMQTSCPPKKDVGKKNQKFRRKRSDTEVERLYYSVNLSSEGSSEQYDLTSKSTSVDTSMKCSADQIIADMIEYNFSPFSLSNNKIHKNSSEASALADTIKVLNIDIIEERDFRGTLSLQEQEMQDLRVSKGFEEKGINCTIGIENEKAVGAKFIDYKNQTTYTECSEATCTSERFCFEEFQDIAAYQNQDLNFTRAPKTSMGTNYSKHKINNLENSYSLVGKPSYKIDINKSNTSWNVQTSTVNHFTELKNPRTRTSLSELNYLQYVDKNVSLGSEQSSTITEITRNKCSHKDFNDNSLVEKQTIENLVKNNESSSNAEFIKSVMEISLQNQIKEEFTCSHQRKNIPKCSDRAQFLKKSTDVYFPENQPKHNFQLGENILGDNMIDDFLTKRIKCGNILKKRNRISGKYCQNGKNKFSIETIKETAAEELLSSDEPDSLNSFTIINSQQNNMTNSAKVTFKETVLMLEDESPFEFHSMKKRDSFETDMIHKNDSFDEKDLIQFEMESNCAMDKSGLNSMECGSYQIVVVDNNYSRSSFDIDINDDFPNRLHSSNHPQDSKAFLPAVTSSSDSKLICNTHSNKLLGGKEDIFVECDPAGKEMRMTITVKGKPTLVIDM